MSLNDRYVILSGSGCSFGEVALVNKELFNALELSEPSELSDETLLLLAKLGGLETSDLNGIKEELEMYFSEPMELFCFLSNIINRGGVIPGVNIFKSITPMFKFAKTNNINIVGDTY